MGWKAPASNSIFPPVGVRPPLCHEELLGNDNWHHLTVLEGQCNAVSLAMVSCRVRLLGFIIMIPNTIRIPLAHPSIFVCTCMLPHVSTCRRLVVAFPAFKSSVLFPCPSVIAAFIHAPVPSCMFSSSLVWVVVAVLVHATMDVPIEDLTDCVVTWCGQNENVFVYACVLSTGSRAFACVSFPSLANLFRNTSINLAWASPIIPRYSVQGPRFHPPHLPHS